MVDESALAAGDGEDGSLCFDGLTSESSIECTPDECGVEHPSDGICFDCRFLCWVEGDTSEAGWPAIEVSQPAPGKADHQTDLTLLNLWDHCIYYK